MRKIASQLELPFQEWTPEARRAANRKAIEQAVAEHYPITTEEKELLPNGVRLARFVPIAECEDCPLASGDHRLNKSTILVCIKDLGIRGKLT